MKQLTLFRILTFILVPVSAMFGFMDLALLASALANPAFLIFVFVLSSFVIYTFTSFQFLTKGIDPGKPCKPALREWIRVNAFVSSFMGILFLLNAVSVFFTNDITLKVYLAKVLETQANVPPMLNIELFVKVMKLAAWFMFFISIILLVHIFLNFRIMKQYRYLFEEPLS